MSVIRETKTGSIETFYDADSGRVKDDGSGEPNDFYHPGARLVFVPGDAVTYLKVTLPTGGVIINDIKKGG
jgi:hypothetical protein